MARRHPRQSREISYKALNEMNQEAAYAMDPSAMDPYGSYPNPDVNVPVHQSWIEEHPWMTLFLGLVGISAVVSIVQALSGPKAGQVSNVLMSPGTSNSVNIPVGNTLVLTPAGGQSFTALSAAGSALTPGSAVNSYNVMSFGSGIITATFANGQQSTLTVFSS